MVRPFQPETDRGEDAGPQALPCTAAGCVLRPGAQLDEFIEQLLQDREQQRVAIGKVRIDRRRGDAGLLGDSAQRNAFARAGFVDQGNGGLEDVLALLPAFTSRIPSTRLHPIPLAIAFSSEADTGSREENASKHESRAIQFRFYRN
nr:MULTISPECIES: hypothetical protein [unclassified Bradyrhizobium]